MKTFEDSFDEAVKECVNYKEKTIDFLDNKHALDNAILAIDLMKKYLIGDRMGWKGNFDGVMNTAYGTFFKVGFSGLYGWKYEMIEHLKKLMISKQRDYGKGNILRFGHVGIMVRVSDKVERLLNLLKNEKSPSNESVVDSYKDLANYAIIGIMLLQGTFERELESEE